MSNEVIQSEALQVYEDTLDLAPRPVMNLETAKRRLKEFQEFVKGYLVEGEDFGIIPGTPKPTLYKPGADKLCELYGFADSYEILDKVEDFERGLFDYNVQCKLTSRRDQTLVATGLGSCNSYEGKYRWRDSQRKCPHCGKEAIIKGKEEYGGGWLCFAKKGGCGAKFGDNDAAITSQSIARVENEDIATLKNTILKMAKKRSKVDATLAATRSSGIFTQDIEDIGGAANDDKDAPKASSNGKREPISSPEKTTAKAVPISEGQVKRMFAIGKQAGMSEDGIKATYQHYGFQHADDVTRDKYDELVESLKKGKAPTGEPSKETKPKAPAKGASSIEGPVSEVSQQNNKGPFILLKMVGFDLYSREERFFETLLGAKGKHCKFMMVQAADGTAKGKIVSILKIGSQEWLEDGCPVKRIDADMMDADIPPEFK